ncbi:MAG: hypothetical protein COY40_04705 [Alphaproteobacteria bacterium CG_4_10_14_0_8_um_filter_53_9]|nr:MAG: hypothetical protein COY40_04705 [Alphaproteobacteria bacterium CG_4_10_14_0_8_um_filter_53_9]
MQIIQKAVDHVHILAMVEEGFEDSVFAALAEKAALKIPAGMRVTFERVDRLARGANGKTPFVVRKFNEVGHG